MFDRHYLSPEGRAAVKAAADALRDNLAARRLLRATAQTIDVLLGERRKEDRPVKVDRRGAVTVEVEGTIVIRPRTDLARFDTRPADISAFMLDDQMRGGCNGL